MSFAERGGELNQIIRGPGLEKLHVGSRGQIEVDVLLDMGNTD